MPIAIAIAMPIANGSTIIPFSKQAQISNSIGNFCFRILTSMFLAIDIGNTNITLGLYNGETLGPRWRLATGREKTPDEYGVWMLSLFRSTGISADDIHAIAMASVVPPLTAAFHETCRQYFRRKPLVVDGITRTGIRILYDDVGQVGADRIVDAAACYSLYGGPACIVDFGTATTFDAVSSEGDYLGGAIAPGIGIATEELFLRAAKLPKVDLHRPQAAIGKNIAQSLQSGLLFGYVGLVEGMVARFQSELGSDMRVIATGGLAEIIAKETEVISIIAPWLTLDGLRIIYDLNAVKQ
jgi:type III pantothenate kinase